MNVYEVWFFCWTDRVRKKHTAEGPYHGDYLNLSDAQKVADELIDFSIPAWVETTYTMP